MKTREKLIIPTKVWKEKHTWQNGTDKTEMHNIIKVAKVSTMEIIENTVF